MIKVGNTRRNPLARAIRNAFSPRDLFAASTIGAIYDFDDFAYLYQKSDGSTPVTALEQPVGFMRDKRWGGNTGADVRSAGAPALLGTATAATFNTSTGAGSVTRVDASNQSSVRFTLTANTFYRITITNSGAATINLRSGTEASTVWATVAAGATSTLLVLASTAGVISITAASAATIAFTVSSLVSLPGLHAYQSTDAARPVLSARYNLLTYSQDYSNAVWTKTDVTPTTGQADPNGGTTAILFTEGSAGTAVVSQSATTTAGQSYTVTRYLKRGNTDWVAIVCNNPALGSDYFRTFVNLATGALGTGQASGAGTFTSHAIRSLGGGWYEVKLTGSLAGITSIACATRTASGDIGARINGGSYVLWGADLRLTADANGRIPAYQRVTTATDYDSAGFPRFLRLDATDDFLQTASVDPGTDKVFVCAGVTKMSDAAAGILLESSTNGNTTNGSFYLTAPNAAAANFGASARGDAQNGRSYATYAAPTTAVLAFSLTSAAADSAAAISGRINGAAQAGTAGGSALSAGNYTSQPIYIGARAGTSLRLNNGRIYPMVICFKAVTAGEIAATEQWLRARCPAVF